MGKDIYAREGLQVAKSTLCGWHEKVAELVRPLVEAMRDDAFERPWFA
jgi:transposase